ncbi:hypothetical protein [Streptomyces sp. NPDC057494]|uniref:hypothetical protein n=1 Tax=Streptomyces sp. NPDC057494 TaxID=3346148 RepID=UPI0036A057CB
MPQVSIDDILARGQTLLTPKNLADGRIDPVAQESIARLWQGEDAVDRIAAMALLSGTKAGELGVIINENSPSAEELAEQLIMDRSDLVSSGVDAALVDPPDGGPPVIVVRADAWNDSNQLDRALAGVIRDSRVMLSERLELLDFGHPFNPKPWLCGWICGLSALALADGDVFDEIPIGGFCLKCVTG